MHRNLDKKRNKENKRKLQLSDFEKTETRRRYRNFRDKLRYQKKLISTFALMQYAQAVYNTKASNIASQSVH